MLTTIRSLLEATPGGVERVAALERTRHEVLGPWKKRDASAARWDKDLNAYVGGTAFERTGNAHPVKGSRAYNLGLSYEKPTQILAPAVGNKGSRTTEWGEGLRMRSEMVKVACT